LDSNRVSPSQIKKEQYTHLYYSFASIDPQTFHIVAAHADDIQLMAEFTALKGPNLQTWIAVGGYDFSDNTTATHTTWSDLCSTAARRAAFISSVRTFMDTHGFQGVDLDWEYPVAKERGGRPEDVVNFVSLLREMRAAYGTSYGISLTLAPDYWYLRYFDAKGLEPYVDHMGFMAYDLHGFWDADVKALGSIVRGQADVREIYNNTIPLAYAELDFSKIDFGVAWYGRGYTLQTPSCNTLGCEFKGPSKPGKCTNAAGVMSLDEVRGLIEEKGLTPRLLQGAMMKELVWDDQWIGYDDEETVAMKKAFANNLGFGGTMAWSVDFNTGVSDSPPVSADGSCGPKNGGTVCEGSGFGDCCSANGWCGSTEGHCGSGCISGKCIQGAVTTDRSCGAGANHAICGNWPAGDCCSPTGWCGNTPVHCGPGCQSGSCIDRNVVYLDPAVYEADVAAQCPPPCVLVLPPVPLAGPTTISVPPFTTSLEVGSSVGGTFRATTTTITVVVQSIVIDSLPQSNVDITNGQTAGTFKPSASLVIPPSIVTVTNGAGQTSARTIVFPPWPHVAHGPADISSNSSVSWPSGTVSVGPPSTWTEPAYTRPPVVLHCTANYAVHYLAEYGAYVTLTDCPGTATSMARDCAPTKTVEVEGESTVSFALGCTLFTGTGTRTTDGPLPTYTTWPEGELTWEEDYDRGHDREKKSTCDLWFFSICIDFPSIKLGGWRWNFPPGVFPPGPPPLIKFPPRITVTGELPGPWPPITIGWDNKLTYPPVKSGQCTTRTADLCATTTTLEIKTTEDRTTTSTHTQTTCTTIMGCKVEDDDWETTKTVSCSRSTITRGNVARAAATPTPESHAQPLQPRVDPNPVCEPVYIIDVIIIPADSENVLAIRSYLQQTMQDGTSLLSKTVEVSASDGTPYSFTSFFFVGELDMDIFDNMWVQRVALGVSAGSQSVAAEWMLTWATTPSLDCRHVLDPGSGR
jgi:chitinase